MIVNGKNAVMGRLASVVCKYLLNGENVIVVNADDIIISGDPTRIMDRIRSKIERGYPTKGPFYPKPSDKIFIRTVRGMLPYKIERGKKALKRLRVYKGCPEQYKESVEVSKSLKDIKCKYMRLSEVSKMIGGAK